MAPATFTGVAEYNDTVLRTAYLAGSSIALALTHTTSEVVGAGNSQLQLLIPQLFLGSPVLPPMTMDTSTVSITGQCTFNGTNELWYLSMRTADTAL